MYVKFTSNLMGKEFLNHSWSKDFITKTSLRELNYKNPYGHKSLILNFGKFIFKCLIMKNDTLKTINKLIHRV